MYSIYDSKLRMCDNCRLERTPDIKIVGHGRRKWTIFTCRMCKLQDIEVYIPVKIWTGTEFRDEVDEPPS